VPSLAPQPSEPEDWRTGSAAVLEQALRDSRQHTLQSFDAVDAALAAEGLRVPQRADLNLPLWELGHIGWFQRWWIGRFAQRRLGCEADPHSPRAPASALGRDEWFDSSTVPHGSRWSLPLPAAHLQRLELTAGLEETLLALTSASENTDESESEAGLYFFRLALAHEDMHHEASLYMAQQLGLPRADPNWVSTALPAARLQIELPSAGFVQGQAPTGFAFDNELQAHVVDQPGYRIDSRVLNWADFLEFVEAGAYDQPQWWSDQACAWIALQQPQAPRYLRRAGSTWQQQRWGRWQMLDLSGPAMHLNAFEAEAWCRWAGRRLPSEAEWERAALQAGPLFSWGQVWEWTADAFQPYPGFKPHPYSDYSAPWFGSRRVLRGASWCTQPRLHHARYRNFYTPERNDIFAGFRTCAP